MYNINMCEEVKDVANDTIDYKDLYIRLLADHENYVKRTKQTINNTARASQANLMVDTVMPIYNDLYCAVAQNVDGADILIDKIASSIYKSDYAIIDYTFIGDVLDGYFDTDYCEAISTVPCSTDNCHNKVVYVAKVGLYDKIKKQVITHAQCVVAN